METSIANSSLTAQKRQEGVRQLFEPKSIAVIGASTRKEAVGYAILHNLLSGGYQGKIFPVNPKTATLENLTCYPSVGAIPEAVDLAVVIVPSSTVAETLKQCADKGITAAIIISAGFREIGPEGSQLEKEVIKIAHEYGISVLGPNCLGMINASNSTRANASFSRTMPRAGNIAFVSQSGALCTAILDYAKGQNIGFSKFVSLGNKAVLNEIDVLRYLRDDPETDVVLMYLEDITDGKEFLELAREMTGDAPKTKPTLVIKSGRTAAGAKAAKSHTGSLMGSDSVYDAIFAQSGVLRVESVQEMFDLAIAFANEPLPKSNRVAIVTNAGGPGIMTTDACVRYGLEIAELDKSTQEELRKVLPPTASVSNPVDVIGDAQHDRYEKALKVIAKDPNVDSIIVILTPQAMTEIEETARVIVNVSKEIKVPLVASFMGIVDVSGGVKILEENNIPHYAFPEDPARAISAMYRYRRWIDRPRTQVRTFQVDKAKVNALIEEVRRSNQKVVPIYQAMEIFQAYGFPLLPFRFARTQSKVVEAAKEIGFPVVIKVVSRQVIHKFDLGGVKLNLKNEEEVARAYDKILASIAEKSPQAQIEGMLVQTMAEKGREVILGMNRDPLFGPFLMFGLGGIYVEIFQDVTFRLAPIRELTARHMVESVKAYSLLKGVRGEKPCDIPIVMECLERLSQLSCEHEEIQEIDINPLLVYSRGQGACVIDARIILK